MAARHLSPLDASFLEIEEVDAGSHMHIGWAMVFDPLPGGGSPGIDRVRAHLEDRLGELPLFRDRLSEPRTGGVSWPSWEPDTRFDIASHVRHATLPAPGGEDDLLDWLADFWSHRLDRGRPLWEITLLDGLEGGRWALVTKTHHAMVDGISGVDVSFVLLDATPEPGAEPVQRHDEPHEEVTDGGARHLLPSLLARGARAGVDAALHPAQLRTMLSRSVDVAKVLVRDDLVGAPRTSLNVPIGGSRRYAVVRIELTDVKAIKRALGGTVNDALLALATGGLRRQLLDRGDELPERGLRAMVPVNVRAAGEHLRLGNRVSSLFVDLPVCEPDSLVRYEKVRAAAESRKSSPEASVSAATVDLSGLAPPALHAAAMRAVLSPRLFNVTITNVPGPRDTLYAFGAPMLEILPLVPIAAGHAVGLAVASYDGEVVFGLNADQAAVPDLDVLAEGIRDELEQLRRAPSADRHARSRRASGAR